MQCCALKQRAVTVLSLYLQSASPYPRKTGMEARDLGRVRLHLEAEDCRMCPESFRNFVAVRTVKMTAGYPRDAYVKVGKNGKIKLGFYENSKIEIKI